MTPRSGRPPPRLGLVRRKVVNLNPLAPGLPPGNRFARIPPVSRRVDKYTRVLQLHPALDAGLTSMPQWPLGIVQPLGNIRQETVALRDYPEHASWRSPSICWPGQASFHV